MRSAFKIFAYLTLPVLTLQAEEALEEEQSALPALKILPVGSSIHDLKAPRFDDDYQMTSLLTAKRMDILSEQELKGESVELSLYKASRPQAATHLQSAIYWPNKQILQSSKNLTITGDRFDIAAQGLTLHLEKHAGFLLGKTQTLFYSDRDHKMTSSVIHSQNQATQKPTKTKSAKKLGLTLATFPALLTAEELKEIDTLAAPSTEQISQIEATTEKQFQDIADANHAIDLQKETLNTAFTSTIGKVEHTSTPNKPITPQKNKVPVSISSSDGMYFDAVNNIIVYSKDVKVSHPKYQLICNDELKVRFTPNPNKATESTTPDTKQPDSLELFKNLDNKIETGEVFVTAVATGGVTIQSKNNKGELIVAKAQTVSYNSKSGVTVLKGGRPTITQGDTIAKLKSDSGYITILPNMSVRISGPHEVKTTLSTLPSQQQ